MQPPTSCGRQTKNNKYVTTDTDTNVAERQEAEALAFSRPLDVHRWSDYPEAEKLVDEVSARCLQGKPSRIQRKHLGLILLDLYVAYLEHPELKLAVSMREGDYRVRIPGIAARDSD
jgi:hypothetical protein